MTANYFRPTVRAMTPKQALKKLRELAGSDAELARWAKVSRQAVANWKKVPAERVLALEVASGLTRNEIRQDIYP